MRISLAIPTRERAVYLRPCLAACVSIRDPDLEIIVSDNASGDDTRAVVESFGDPRIRYVNTGRRVSQRENFENALRFATGDYVMIIGDDDGVLPGQWPLLRAILARDKPDALSWPAVFYQWPSPHKRAGGGLLRLRRELVLGDPFWRETETHKRSLCALERSREDLSPKLYHGMVARPVLERLRTRTGDILMSGQVDAYFAAAALAVMDRYLYVRHPFTILAMGPQSGGTSVLEQFSASGRHNDALHRVAEEAASDPVTEAMVGPFPTLGFYYLAGIEQARRKVFGGTLALDYARYFRMILDQLAAVPEAAQAAGLRTLHELAVEAGCEAALEREIAASAPSRWKFGFGQPLPVPAALRPIIQPLESLSYVSTSKIVLDLKRPGRADIHGATRMVDHLLGGADTAEIGEARDLRWRETLLRARQACRDIYFRPQTLTRL